MTTWSPGLKLRDAGADGDDFARRFGADRQRQLALGERHAAKAPDVDVVEADGAHANLHLASLRRRRRGQFGKFQLAVSNQHEREHAHLQTRLSIGSQR